MGLLLLSPFLLRKLRQGVISLVIVGSALLGAAADSPLYPLAAYLYLHVPGYGSLNGSYYWDWFIIVPLYFLLFTLLLKDIASRLPIPNSTRSLQPRSPSLPSVNWRLWQRRIPRTWVLPLFTILVVTVLATPVLSQGYYNNPNGINDAWGITMPPSYATIQPELARLMGSSTGGVAYFNPDNNLNFSGSSNFFVNPLIGYPEQRTASLTYYAAPATASNRFFYWVYSLFYQNETRYLGQLMSLAGIEYFVVLNGTNSYSYEGGLLPFSEGKNASQLMEYQFDVLRAYTGHGYVIYHNLAYAGTANVISNVTLVAGGFNELNVLPYFGFNLSSQVPVLSADLNPSLYSALIPRTRSVVVPSFNALYGIVLSSLQSPEALANYATASSPQEGWTSAWNVPESDFYLYDSVDPVAMAQGAQSMTVPLTITTPGNYTVWIGVYYSENPAWKGGSLRIQAGSTSASFNTSGAYQGFTNAFTWQNIQTYLTPGETLTIQSLNGWNAVDSLFVLPSGRVPAAFQAFNASVARYGIQVYQLAGGGDLAPDAASSDAPYQVSTTESGNTPFGQVSYLSVQQPYSSSMTLSVPAYQNASLVIHAVDTDGGLFEVANGNSSVTFGFGSQNFTNPANATVSSLLVPFRGLTSGTLAIRLLSGFVFIAGIALVPGITTPSKRASVPSGVGVSYVYAPSGQEVSNFSSSQKSNGSTLLVSTSFDYNATAPNYTPLVSIGFNLTFPYNETIRASAEVGPEIYVAVNSVLVGPTPSSGFYVSSDLYGSIDSSSVPYLYIDVYSRSPSGSGSTGNVTFALDLSFYDNAYAYTYSAASQLQAENPVLFNPSGYSVQNCQELTWVRLPYYNLMQATPSVARFSLDSALGQLLVVSRPVNISIEVSYVGEVLTLGFVGISTISALIVAGIIFRRRGKKKGILGQTHMPKARRHQVKEPTRGAGRNSDGQIRGQ